MNILKLEQLHFYVIFRTKIEANQHHYETAASNARYKLITRNHEQNKRQKIQAKVYLTK